MADTPPKATGPEPSSPTDRSTPPPVQHEPGEDELQPGEHWTEQGLPEDDNDSALGDDTASSSASISSSILEYRELNGRTYHSDRGSHQYWGPNDEQQNDTLDIQHHVFTLAMNGQLHFAPLSDKIEKAVDIGTGTGIWAVDFGDQYPNTKVIGTDLSPIQPSWVPPNVHFEIDDFAQDWTFKDDSLDFVHTRWLVGSVTDWTALFKQAYMALKPGAWLESFEVNGFFESDDNTLPNKSALAQWGMIFRDGARKLGSTASFAVVRDQLQRQAMEAAGFVNIQEKAIKLPTSGWPKDPELKKIGQFTRAAIENDIEGAVGFMATQIGWTQDEIRVYAAHLRKELRSNQHHSYYRANVMWAQKPKES